MPLTAFITVFWGDG